MTTALAEREAAPAALTPAQKQRTRLDAFMGAVEKRQDQIGTLLSDSGIDPRLFLEGCRRSLMRDPDLVTCEPATFIQAALNCASDGLVPDGRKAAIVKFKGAAQYMPMYQGLLDVAYRSGQFMSIEGRVVYEGDEFDYDLGDEPYIRHKHPLESTSTKIIGAYAIARTVNGGVFREVMGAAELAKVRAVSRAKSGPNFDWPGEMARKAPVRRIWKYLPKTPAMDRVAIHDDATYDQTALAPPVHHGRALQPGFSTPAIEHQPAEDITPTVDELLDGDHIPDFEAHDAEHEPLSAADQGGGGANNLSADADDEFPGDRPPGGFSPAVIDPDAWKAAFETRLAACAAEADIDALLAEPDEIAGFTALNDAKPALATALNAAITGKRKALRDKARGE